MRQLASAITVTTALTVMLNLLVRATPLNSEASARDLHQFRLGSESDFTECIYNVIPIV